jgi:hypothetical protein
VPDLACSKVELLARWAQRRGIGGVGVDIRATSPAPDATLPGGNAEHPDAAMVREHTLRNHATT